MINIADLILILILLVALIVGSITDFKKREVPDWLSFSLIALGIGIRLCYSILASNWSYILNGLAGFGLFLVIALIMFYAGQWGGGDSKVLMGIGAILGINVYPISRLLDSFIIGFFINMLFAGAIFGLIFTIYLAIRNWQNFKKEFIKIASDKKNRIACLILKIIFIIAFIGTIFFQDVITKIICLSITLMSLPAIYLVFAIKAVEKSCMIKYVKPQELTEGDWIVKDIKINDKRICGPKDLGIEKSQIRKLINYYKKGKIKKILIKEGIPFVPSFLLALIATMIYGNWFLKIFF